jgi:hypothetical protein
MSLCETLWMLWITLWTTPSSSTGIPRRPRRLWNAVDDRRTAVWPLTWGNGQFSPIHNPYYSPYNSLRESS